METIENAPVPFECKSCDYVTNKKGNYDKHLLTRKHKSSNMEKTIVCFHCKICSKEYKTQSGMWKHEKTCKVTPVTIQKLLTSNSTLTEIVLKQQEESQKEKEILMNQIRQQQKQLNELIPRIGNVINIQVFLNETCKDAVNWNDFIKTLPHSTNISKTICDGIEELGMYKRPVHCFEEKQLCIKHENVWEHDMTKINATMDQTNHAMKHQWEQDHPQWYTNAKETEEYTKLFQKEIRPDNLTTFTV
jgi:hypothetical protein